MREQNHSRSVAGQLIQKWKCLPNHRPDEDTFERGMFGEIVIDDGEYTGVCGVYRTMAGDDDFIARDQDTKAVRHAALIEGAPDLLVALKEARSELIVLGRELREIANGARRLPTALLNNETMAMIDAALAKVKGPIHV
jgi:hypothetical protein